MLLKIQYWSLPIGLPTRSPFSHHAHTHAAVRCMCAARPKHINIMKCDVDLCICMGHQQHNDDYQATVNSPLFSSLAKQEYHKWAKQKIKKKISWGGVDRQQRCRSATVSLVSSHSAYVLFGLSFCAADLVATFVIIGTTSQWRWRFLPIWARCQTWLSGRSTMHNKL